MPRVLYIGPCNPESTVETRGLPSRNAAAFNRMLRLARGMGASYRWNIQVVSAGVNLNIKRGKRVFARTEHHKLNDVAITVLPAILLPIVGFLMEPLIVAGWMLAALFSERPIAVVAYNATIPHLLVGLLAKITLVPFVYDIEDVPTFASLRASKKHGLTRVIQEASWLFSSSIMKKLADAFIVPSVRFISELNLTGREKGKCLLVTGCVSVTPDQPTIASLLRDKRPLRVLFAGKLESEHGFDLLLDAIQRLDSDQAVAGRITFDLCGALGKEFTTDDIPRRSHVRYHGYVSDTEYATLLQTADVALALQKSSGLHAHSKTPSKAYEFLAAGKVLIGTSVGDLAELYPDNAIRLHPETGQNLAAVLKAIVEHVDDFIPLASRAIEYAFSNYSFEAVGERFAEKLP